MLLQEWAKDIKILIKIINKKRRKQLLLAGFISVIAAFLEIINIAFVSPYIKIITGEKIENNFIINIFNLKDILFEKNVVILISITFIGFIFITMLFRVLTIYIQFRLSAIIVSEIGLNIFEKSLKLPYEWHIKTNSNVIKSYLTKDLDNVTNYIQMLIMILVNSILSIAISGYLIFLYPLRMSIILSIVAMAYILIFIKIKTSLTNDGKLYSSDYQKTLKISDEVINNYDFINISKTLSFFLKKFEIPNKSFRKMGANINIKSQIPKYIIESFILISIIILTLIIFITNKTFKEELTFLSTVGLGIYKILIPLQGIFTAISGIQAYTPSFKKIYKLQNLKFPIKTKRKKVYQMDQNIFLEFKNVYFKYENSNYHTLNNINLKIKSGDKIGIVGYSGSGKSTFIKLLIGLLRPTKGNITFENHNIFENENTILNLHNQISYVPQEIFLCDSDIITNIGYGIERDLIDFEKLERCAKISQIQDFINSLPYKYESNIGEKGLSISGGQRQRIGIARGLYKEHNLLVLDESLSAMDSINESNIINRLFKFYKNKTIVMVSHRLTSLKKCDSIILFDRGNINDIGTFEDLKSRNKKFINLLQSSS